MTPRHIMDSSISDFNESAGQRAVSMWDDCSDDNTSYWMYVTVSNMTCNRDRMWFCQSYESRSTQRAVLEASKLKNDMRRAILKTASEHGYSVSWHVQERPRKVDKHGDYYDRQHWLVVVRFYGGPDAVTLKQLLD